MNKGDILATEDLFTSSMGEVGFELGENEAEAPASKAASNRQAKARMSALQSRTSRGMGVAAKLSCGRDVVNGMRLVSLGTLAEQEEFCRLDSDLKGPKSRLKYMYE